MIDRVRDAKSRGERGQTGDTGLFRKNSCHRYNLDPFLKDS